MGNMAMIRDKLRPGMSRTGEVAPPPAGLIGGMVRGPAARPEVSIPTMPNFRDNIPEAMPPGLISGMSNMQQPARAATPPIKGAVSKPKQRIKKNRAFTMPSSLMGMY